MLVGNKYCTKCNMLISAKYSILNLREFGTLQVCSKEILHCNEQIIKNLLE